MTKEEFIGTISHWDSHRPLLWEAVANTNGHVMEMGMGHGSTAQLHQLCRDSGRMLFSYENNKEWLERFTHLRSGGHYIEFVDDWDNVIQKHREPIGVVFVDQAPGERRKYDMALFCNLAQVIVVHDTEPGSDHGYRTSLAAPLFKYRKDFTDFPAHATAFSNFIDVSKWQL